MDKHSIHGVWRLVMISDPRLKDAKFTSTLHFTDSKYVFEDNGHELTRQRYALDDRSVPHIIEIGGRKRFYSIDGGKLSIREMTADGAMPLSNENAVVAVYEYVGSGPPEWKAEYKARMRQQLGEVARRFATQTNESDSRSENG